jgi:hypothetical protein
MMTFAEALEVLASSGRVRRYSWTNYEEPLFMSSDNVVSTRNHYGVVIPMVFDLDLINAKDWIKLQPIPTSASISGATL